MNGLSIVPVINVEFDGSGLPRGVLGTLEGFTLRHELSQPSLCELSFVAPARDFLPRPGAHIIRCLGERTLARQARALRQLLWALILACCPRQYGCLSV